MRRLAGLFAVVCVLGLVAWRAGLWWLVRSYLSPPRVVVMPVDGVAPKSVVSQWHAPRPQGRRHEGVDLFAARGTVVRSATRGRIWRVGWDSLGGRVVTVLGEGHSFYYYAHLSDWADGLHVGQRVVAGEPLGLVGNGGNARTTPPHLHFGVYRIGWWRSQAIDPAPLLRHAVLDPENRR
jgi:murein DD-endopeptidase MepM/ murein hydrolase activator NlpD